MPRVTVAGHPLHPQLIAFPLGLLPFSFVMDVAYMATGKKSFARAAKYCMTGGLVPPSLLLFPDSSTTSSSRTRRKRNSWATLTC